DRIRAHLTSLARRTAARPLASPARGSGGAARLEPVFRDRRGIPTLLRGGRLHLHDRTAGEPLSRGLPRSARSRRVDCAGAGVPFAQVTSGRSAAIVADCCLLAVAAWLLLRTPRAS